MSYVESIIISLLGKRKAVEVERTKFYCVRCCKTTTRDNSIGGTHWRYSGSGENNGGRTENRARNSPEAKKRDGRNKCRSPNTMVPNRLYPTINCRVLYNTGKTKIYAPASFGRSCCYGSPARFLRRTPPNFNVSFFRRSTLIYRSSVVALPRGRNKVLIIAEFNRLWFLGCCGFITFTLTSRVITTVAFLT